MTAIDKNSVQIKAYCKINLTLDIKGIREDKYHEVDMIMQTIPLYDVVTIQKNPNFSQEKIKMTSNAQWVPTDIKNTAYKAAQMLMNDFEKIDTGIDIFIDKRVPGCGGLGGSSADAAAVLLGINDLFELGLSIEELYPYASKIGADVPFLLKSGAAIAGGTGTDLKYIEPLTDCILLLVNSGIEISTPESYKLYDVLMEQGKIPENAHQSSAEAAALMEQGIEALADKMKNVLEFPAFYTNPSLEIIKKEIKDMGATASMMSGSGGTMFGIFSKKNILDAVRAQQEFGKRGWFSFICNLEKIEI